MLDESGFGSAVKLYVEGLEKRTGIKASIDVSLANFPRWKPETETAIFRVAEQAQVLCTRSNFGSGVENSQMNSGNEREASSAMALERDGGTRIVSQIVSAAALTADTNHKCWWRVGEQLGSLLFLAKGTGRVSNLKQRWARIFVRAANRLFKPLRFGCPARNGRVPSRHGSEVCPRCSLVVFPPSLCLCRLCSATSLHVFPSQSNCTTSRSPSKTVFCAVTVDSTTRGTDVYPARHHLGQRQKTVCDSLMPQPHARGHALSRIS
jgi:hypothetical protein